MSIDLSRKTRGMRPLYHFIIVPIILVVFSLFFLMAVIDYKNFDAKFAEKSEDDVDYENEVRFAFWRVFMMPMFGMWCSALFYFLLICCPNRIWFALLSFVLIIYTIIKFTGLSVSTSDAVGHRVIENYYYGRIAFVLCSVVYLVADIYMAVVLFILGFFHKYDDEEEGEVELEVVVSDKSSSVEEDSSEKTEKSEY